jgi:DnaK suppressor protein
VKTQAVKAKTAAKTAKVAPKGKAAPKAAPVAKAKPKAAPAKPAKAVKAVKTVKSTAAKSKPAKPVAKAAAKPAAKAAPAKNVTKSAPAKAIKAKAAPAKASKSAPAKASKPVAKVAPAKAKESARPVSKLVASKPAAKATVAAVPSKAKPSTPAPVAAAPSSPVNPVAAAVPAPAQKAGRPSSRLAQLTVPSMAQSVASTAAKASYIQTMSAPLIAPPVASAAKKDPKLANNWKTKPVEQLTDADLLAMPDAEYMNATQMAVFRLKLSVLKQDILSMAGETTEHLREDTVVVPDPADRATIEEEHALELRTRDRERKLLKKIEQSIARIDAGDYGYCDETGEPIGVGRLLARPTATLSLEAQQRRELKQKMFGD